MLQKMREKMQGIVAGTIVALIAVTFALWGIQYYSHGFSERGIVAKVNGEKITEQELRRAYSRAQQQNLALLGKESYFDQKAQAALKEKVKEQAIKNKVLVALSDKLGLYVGKEQLQATIMDLPMFQEANGGGFSAARFNQMLSNLSYSEQEFSRELQGFLLLSQLEYGVTQSAFVLPNEVNEAIKLLKQSRDFNYCLFAPEHFSTKVTVSAAEIKEYYEQHQKEFSTPEKVSIEYIELNADAIKNKLNPTAAELQQFYKEHAALFSRDNSASKEHIKAVYDHYTLQQLLAEQSDKLADLTYTNSNSLAPAASALGLTIKSTDFFTRQEIKENKVDNSKVKNVVLTKITKKSKSKGIKAVGVNNDVKSIITNNKVIKAAFSENVLQQGYNSNPIEIGDNDVVVVRIKNHIPTTVLPLDKVRAAIIAAVKKEKTQLLAKESATEFLEALLAGDASKVAALSKKYGVTWQTAKKVMRGSSGYDRAILNSVFALARPGTTTDSKTVAVVDLQNKGYVVVKVIKVYDSNPKDVAVKDYQVMSDTLRNGLGRFDYSLLTNAAMQKAKIKIYEDPAASSAATDDE